MHALQAVAACVNQQQPLSRVPATHSRQSIRHDAHQINGNKLSLICCIFCGTSGRAVRLGHATVAKDACLTSQQFWTKQRDQKDAVKRSSIYTILERLTAYAEAPLLHLGTNQLVVLPANVQMPAHRMLAPSHEGLLAVSLGNWLHVHSSCTVCASLALHTQLHLMC